MRRASRGPRCLRGRGSFLLSPSQTQRRPISAAHDAAPPPRARQACSTTRAHPRGVARWRHRSGIRPRRRIQTRSRRLGPRPLCAVGPGTVAQVTERPTDHNHRAQLVARNRTNHQDRSSTQTKQTARIQRRTIASHATRMCWTDRHPGCPRGASQVAFLATGTVLRDLAAPRGRGCGRQVPEEATWPRPTTATA